MYKTLFDIRYTFSFHSSNRLNDKKRKFTYIYTMSDEQANRWIKTCDKDDKKAVHKKLHVIINNTWKRDHRYSSFYRTNSLINDQTNTPVIYIYYPLASFSKQMSKSLMWIQTNTRVEICWSGCHVYLLLVSIGDVL